MDDLTGFQRVCLLVITGLENPYGLAITDELADYDGDKIITAGWTRISTPSSRKN